MKRILPLLLALSMCFVLAACGNSGNIETAGTAGQTALEEESPATTEESETLDEVQKTEESNIQQTEDVDTDGTKILVAYFSRTGENYSVGYIEKGNTHIIADMIAEQVGADTFEISTVAPYPDDYDECTEVAKQEQEENARPELTASVENMADYDVIILGYPIWHGQAPRIISTFLESYDFSGKTIVPFCTSHSSGIGSSADNLHSLCTDSVNWLDGKRFEAGTTKETLEEWFGDMEIE